MSELTDRLLKELTLADGQRDRLVFDSACPGLGVRLTRARTRTFIVQWTDPATKGKVREPLGVWGALTIDQAREAARVRLGAVAKGINPRAERAKARADAERERVETALTFDALVTEWASLHLVKRRPRYAAEAVRAIRYAFAGLMKRPAARIEKSEALSVLDRLVREGKAVTAGRTMSYARSAFSWAEKRGKVPCNPFRGLPIVPLGEARERALTDFGTGGGVGGGGRDGLSVRPSVPPRHPDIAATGPARGDAVVRAFERFDYMDDTGSTHEEWQPTCCASLRRQPRSACGGAAGRRAGPDFHHDRRSASVRLFKGEGAARQPGD